MQRVSICADLQTLSHTHAHTFEKVYVPVKAVKGGVGGRPERGVQVVTGTAGLE